MSCSFDPVVHGFPFPNCFPAGKPLWSYQLPLTRLSVGNASKGMCGGMVFAALDCWYHRVAIPNDPELPGLHQYLANRLWDSFRFPLGVARIYHWMSKGNLLPLTLREWPGIKTRLDNAEPVPLMLIKTQSRNPWNLGENHQVLATSYRLDPSSGKVTIALYEPNYPVRSGDEEVTLTFDVRNTLPKGIVHSREGESVRGFFANAYTIVRPTITNSA